MVTECLYLSEFYKEYPKASVNLDDFISQAKIGNWALKIMLLKQMMMLHLTPMLTALWKHLPFMMDV
jgi:hypothetical protein